MLKIFVLLCLCSAVEIADAADDVGYTHVIFIDDRPKCAGTLISRMWAMTTCLCVREFPIGRITIRIGDPYRKHNGEKHVFYSCSKLEVHPQCITAENEYCAYHDVAIIMLNEPFFDSAFILIVKIPNQLEYWTPDDEVDCSISCYTDLQDKMTDLAHAVWASEVKILHPRECEHKLRKRDFVLGKCTCASYHHPQYNKCDLDLGAPLVSSFMLIALLIHKNQCGAPGMPASYVNIAYHSRWIRDTCHKDTNWIDI